MMLVMISANPCSQLNSWQLYYLLQHEAQLSPGDPRDAVPVKMLSTVVQITQTDRVSA